MLYAGEHGVSALRAYESKAIPILREHGGQLLSAFTPAPSSNQEQVSAMPDEVHVIEFPSAEQFERYCADSRVAALRNERAEAIANSVVFVSGYFVDYVD